MPFPLTDEQRSIVDDRGGELLVSAAAGSGKTRVLVERLLDRVTKEGLDIDRFLVITYTKAAAAELRGRIAQELSDRLALAPNDRHLRRQTTLVYRAKISTVIWAKRLSSRPADRVSTNRVKGLSSGRSSYRLSSSSSSTWAMST